MIKLSPKIAALLKKEPGLEEPGSHHLAEYRAREPRLTEEIASACATPSLCGQCGTGCGGRAAALRANLDRAMLEEPPTQKRCDKCAVHRLPFPGSYELDNPELCSNLRCPYCDFPFYATLEGMRACALALQERKNLCNVYSQVACYIWLQFVPNELDLEEFDNVLEFGVKPDWMAYEFESVTWDEIITTDHSNHETWLLQEGLCPGQPFLVEFEKPIWSRSGGEYDEYDVDYSWDILCRLPKSPEQAARSWDRWLKAGQTVQYKKDLLDTNRRLTEAQTINRIARPS
jgi:hypothetical protein